MRKLVFLLGFMILFTTVFAWDFDIEMSGPLTGNAILTLKINNIDNIKTVDLKVWDIVLPKVSKQDNLYTFSIPTNFKINPLDKHIKIDIYKHNKTVEYYFYDKFFPQFIDIDLTDLTWGKQVKLNWYFTGSCKLFYDKDKSWSISVNSKSNAYYVTIPKQIDKPIYWGYVNCDGLSSNYVKFYIPASPKILYVISKSKHRFFPGSKAIIVWTNIKLTPNDKIKVLLDSEEIPFKFLGNNKLEITLPNKNLINVPIKIIRNWFESNIVNVTSKINIFLKNVDIYYDSAKKYIRLHWEFNHFKEWNPEVTFNGKELSVINTGTDVNWDYIDIEYPELSKTNDGFSCSWYLENGYFQVNIWWVKSNLLYYTPYLDNYINYILKPNCDNVGCYVKLYLNKTLSTKVEFFLNDELTKFSSLGNLVRLITDDIIEKWNVYFVNQFCVKSPKYYFDFSDDFKPYITYIESKDNFKSQSNFTIYGENFRDNSWKDINLNVSFSPNNVVDKYRKAYSTIEGHIIYGAKDGQKVNVSISTRHWEWNWGYFVIGGKKKYLWNPEIFNVLYPNWWEGWQEAIIKWVGFSDVCYENKIYFGNKVIYPQECSFNELKFIIPSNFTSNKLLVETPASKSNLYTLSSTIGWSVVSKIFSIDWVSSLKVINLNLKKATELSFKIDNTLTDVYVDELRFIFSWVDYFPLENVTLSINDDDSKYYFSKDQNKIIKTSQKLTPIVKKISPNKYELIFRGVYIPFSLNSLTWKIKFDLSSAIPNNTLFSIYFPSQTIYYHNIFSDSEISKSLKINKTFNITYKVINPVNVCFDSSSTNENCALALIWTSIKKTKTNMSTSVSKNNHFETKKTISHSTKNSKLSKQAKIAARLNLAKMKLLNSIIKKFIIKLKKKYWWTPKIKYVVWMYKGYKIMLLNTSNDWDKKINYVNWLIVFAKYYFAFTTPGLKK